MENQIQADGAAEQVAPETKALMDNIRQQGHSFDGDKPAEPVKEAPKDPENSQKEPEKEPEKTEEKKAEKTPERKPREIPAFQVEIDKKRVEKAHNEEKNALATRIDSLEAGVKSILEKLTEKANITAPEQANIEQEIEELSNKLDTGEITMKDYTKKVIELSAKSLSKAEKAEITTELQTKLSKIDELEKEGQLAKEEKEFSNDFDKSIIPVIKKDYPHASDEDITAIKAKFHNFYFDSRYITLSSLEIYKLQKEEFEKEISPEPRGSVEAGTRGAVGRETRTIDLDNVSEDDYKKMTPEEQKKVMDYKIAKERESSGIIVH